MYRKNFFLAVTAMILLPAALYSWEKDDSVPIYGSFFPGTDVLTVPPVMQHLTETETAFVWVTRSPAFSRIEFREMNKDGEWNVVIREKDGLYDAGSTLHRIFLDGLKTDTEYEMRIRTKPISSFHHCPIYGPEHLSPVYIWKTKNPAQQGTRFAVLNDLHQNRINYRIHLEKAVRYGCEAVYLNGDSVNMLSYPKQIVRYMLLDTENLRASVPVYNGRGNHETRGGAARSLGDFFYTPDGHIYRLILTGDTAVVLTDTGEDKPDTHREYGGAVSFHSYRKREKTWLEKTFQSPEWQNAKYKIAVGHIPIWEKKNKEDDNRSYSWQTEWMDLYNRYGVQLLIAGHTHNPRILPPQTRGRHLYPIVVGGGSGTADSLLLVCETGNNRILVRAEHTDGREAFVFETDLR